MIKIQQSNEKINSNGGNILIGKLISDIGLEKMNQQNTKRIMDAVEKATGLDFFSAVPKETQEKLESTISVSDWTWKNLQQQ